MAGLKELRTRLDSAKSTQQLTSAMKMVSVSKLRRAQNRATRVREMCLRLLAIYRAVVDGKEACMEDCLLHEGYARPANVLVIVLASDKGMCGVFNTSVCRAAEEHIKKSYARLSRSDIGVFSIGNKAGQYFASKGYARLLSEACCPANEMDYPRLSVWMDKVIEHYESGKIQKVDVVYCRPVNAATHSVRVQELLPVAEVMKLGEAAEEEYRKKGESAALIGDVKQARHRAAFFQPGQVEILPDLESVIGSLLPKVAALYLYLALCQSSVAEHGARMTAMSQATDNAEELIKELNLKYNKLRQSGITNELIEIVSGATAQG